MCGRYTLTNTSQLSLRFAADAAGAEPGEPRFNVAPSQQVPVVLAGRGGRVLDSMRWGFQPGWLKDKPKGPPPINARAETLLERPLFRSALPRHRCLLPADGFYEWQSRQGAATKQPYFIHLKDGALFAFAGLWTERQGEDGAILRSCALITSAPNELMAPIHNRMPVILRPEDEAAWLDPERTAPESLLDLLQPYPPDLMEAYPVAQLVSSVRNDDPRLVQPLAGG